MGKKRKTNYSGIGGQAVIEGIMMRNQDKYALACRKPDGEIAVDVKETPKTSSEKVIHKIPLVRGIFIFFDSLSTGMETLTASAQYYDDDIEETWLDKVLGKIFGKNAEKIVLGFTLVLSVLLAVGIFIVLPYFISSIIGKYIFYDALVAVIEGVLRLLIFLLYLILVSCVKDMRRVFMYHGAEHKCINCIEKGMPLNVRNVMHASRKHRRCGTSFLVLVMVITIILFFFIRVDSQLLKVGIRLLMIPVIAGISYEFLRLAGKYDNIFTRIISAPGMLLQSLTTREPDEKMAEVAIAAVEAVFDWKQYLRENFNYKFAEGEEDEEIEEKEAENGETENETAENEAVENEAVESEAVESEAVESEAVENEAVESEAVESEAVESEAVESEAAESEETENIVAINEGVIEKETGENIEAENKTMENKAAEEDQDQAKDAEDIETAKVEVSKTEKKNTVNKGNEINVKPKKEKKKKTKTEKESEDGKEALDGGLNSKPDSNEGQDSDEV